MEGMRFDQRQEQLHPVLGQVTRQLSNLGPVERAVIGAPATRPGVQALLDGLGVTFP